MKHIISIILLFSFAAGLAQPVNRIKLRQLQNPPDTTSNYRILSNKDTAEWVLVGVSSITNVPDTSSLSPNIGDVFINTAQDTMGFYDGTQWRLFLGGDGNGIISALPAGDVTINAGGNDLTINQVGEFEVYSPSFTSYIWMRDTFVSFLTETPGSIRSRMNTNLGNVNLSATLSGAGAAIFIDTSGVYVGTAGTEAGKLYRFPLTAPSTTLNDTSVIAWVGTGAATTPQFLDYSLATGGGAADGDGIKDATTGLPGGDVTIASGQNKLTLQASTPAGATTEVISIEIDSTSDDRTTHALEVISPQDSFKIVQFDGGVDLIHYQTAGSGLGLRVIGDKLTAQSDSMSLNFQTGTVTDSRAAGTAAGLKYNADYSSNYTDRSLPDKAYVDKTRKAHSDVTPSDSTTIAAINLGSYYVGIYQVNMTTAATTTTVTFNAPTNPVDGGVYTFHWQNVASNEVDFPATFLDQTGTAWDASTTYTMSSDFFMTCYWDGTNYYCK